MPSPTASQPDSQHRFAGKIALITGGASGIGAAVAKLLDSEGAAVWIADRDVERARATTSLLRSARFCQLDVTSDSEWRACVDQVLRESGRLDVVVNAAGISMTSGATSVADVSIEDWRAIFRVNVEGTLLGCQHAMRVMDRRGGAIVNISSTAAHAPSPALAAYGASKAAVLQLTKSVAAACALRGLPIRCNAVLPGMTDTPMTSHMSAEYRQKWENQIPAARFAAPVEIAHVIAFLASDASSYVNGAGYPVDGGLLARPVVK